jgi:hypothetical protein
MQQWGECAGLLMRMPRTAAFLSAAAAIVSSLARCLSTALNSLGPQRNKLAHFKLKHDEARIKRQHMEKQDTVVSAALAPPSLLPLGRAILGCAEHRLPWPHSQLPLDVITLVPARP